MHGQRGAGGGVHGGEVAMLCSTAQHVCGCVGFDHLITPPSPSVGCFGAVWSTCGCVYIDSQCFHHHTQMHARHGGSISKMLVQRLVCHNNQQGQSVCLPPCHRPPEVLLGHVCSVLLNLVLSAALLAAVKLCIILAFPLHQLRLLARSVSCFIVLLPTASGC